jgi:hypothetical protein
VTDNLVERLREGFATNLEYDAADRIEALEKDLNAKEIETMRLKRSVTKYHRQSLKDAAHIDDMRQALRRNMIYNAQEARAALEEKKDD